MHSRLNIDIFLFSTKLPCRSIWHTNRYFYSHSYCISFFRCLWQFSQAPSGFLTSAHSQAPCSWPPLPPSLFPSSSPSWAPSGSRTKKNSVTWVLGTCLACLPQKAPRFLAVHVEASFPAFFLQSLPSYFGPPLISTTHMVIVTMTTVNKDSHYSQTSHFWRKLEYFH